MYHIILCIYIYICNITVLLQKCEKLVFMNHLINACILKEIINMLGT